MTTSIEIYDYCVKNGFSVERTMKEIYLHGSDCNIEFNSTTGSIYRRSEPEMLAFIESIGGRLDCGGFFLSSKRNN